eukprot:COSAG01_NODE_1867_length_9028_cov_5.343673_10_plen_84_part_00
MSPSSAAAGPPEATCGCLTGCMRLSDDGLPACCALRGLAPAAACMALQLELDGWALFLYQGGYPKLDTKILQGTHPPPQKTQY